MSAIDLEVLDSKEWSKPCDLVEQCSQFGINKDEFESRLVTICSDARAKSELLKSLTGIKFKTSSSGATIYNVHFNTEILLRRTDDDRHLNASIVLNTGPISKEFKDKLSAFKISLTGKELGPKGFSYIYNQAAAFMEQSRKDSQQYPHSNFEWLAIGDLYSPHVLKIEISGRRLPNLSIFDFDLGIHNHLHAYIFPKDLDIKSTLSYRYLTNPCAILLMVVEGQKDSEIEEVSNMALQVDPGRTRTIGAIKGRVGIGNISGLSNFQRTEISSYRVRRSHHAWFVVRNRTTKEIEEGTTIQEGYALERDYFNSSLWSHLNPDNLGVENLKAFIGRLMFEQVRKRISRTLLWNGSLDLVHKLRRRPKIPPDIDTVFSLRLNDWKVFLEDKLRQPISFWPLSQPQRRCKDGSSRLWFDCHHGKELSIDIPNSLLPLLEILSKQDKIKRTPLILETEENATNKSSQLRRNEAIARGYSSGFSGFGQTEINSGSFMQKRGQASQLGSAGDPSSSTVTNNTSKPDDTRTVGSGSRGSGTGNSPTGAANRNMTLHGQGQNQATSINTNILPGQFDIFFVVHCTDNRAAMKVIRMLGIHRDSDLFQSIRENYNLIRGWRRFFSFTTICDIQWVRFKRYSTKPVSKSDGLCDNIFESLPDRADRDYQIDTREPPKPMIRPISRQHIMELYETPKDSENCNECLRTAMPKWVGSNADTKLKESAWGIYSVEGFALFKILIWAFIVNLVPIVFFVPWWLKTHPGDLQNAFVPNAVVSMFYYGTVSICISIRVGTLRS
ncbi:hypothetical protein TWF102_002312 [Orbilia oligospora]|uniref:Uncharacterized protein n=1 Tax=Orbilia oligospora TaxID=2813651 RepID=A0A7C8NB98_ORBOL|nr:hypothetical protein TWF103_008710 [Orbilia oligospora]KAF3099618.1 hypothetical protein TWF103_008710 [Orbilia oligospora]KAF3105391.1 hypothetical protein TWF102_002312 [Orbilia oligospora]KAF3150176.1 hypothetical protein TWF594_010059 [Orbilia oligospora]